jgi:hypothetical protein
MDRLLNENRRRPQDPGGGAEAVPPAPAPPADRRDRRRPDGVPCSLAAQVRRGGRCRASAAAQLLPGQLRRPFGARVRWAESPSQRAGGNASPASDWRAIEISVRARRSADVLEFGPSIAMRVSRSGGPTVRPRRSRLLVARADRALRRLVGRGSSMGCLHKQHPGTVAATTTASSGSQSTWGPSSSLIGPRGPISVEHPGPDAGPVGSGPPLSDA